MQRQVLLGLMFFFLASVPLVGCSGEAQVLAGLAAADNERTDVIAFSSRHEGNPEICNYAMQVAWRSILKP
jgi:hypothetical protein